MTVESGDIGKEWPLYWRMIVFARYNALWPQYGSSSLSHQLIINGYMSGS